VACFRAIVELLVIGLNQKMEQKPSDWISACSEIAVGHSREAVVGVLLDGTDDLQLDGTADLQLAGIADLSPACIEREPGDLFQLQEMTTMAKRMSRAAEALATPWPNEIMVIQ
jgi:hypothetical protein